MAGNEGLPAAVGDGVLYSKLRARGIFHFDGAKLMVKRYLAGIGKAADTWRSSTSGVTGQLASLNLRLIGSFLGAAALFMAERNVVLDDFKSFQALLGPGPAGSNSDRALGLTTEKLVQIRKRSQTSSSAAKRWWTLVEGSLEIYKRPDGQTGWFSVRPIE